MSGSWRDGNWAIRAAKKIVSSRLSCRKATADVAVALTLAVHNDPRSRAWDSTGPVEPMVRLTFFALVAVLCSTPSALAEAAADSCDASLSTSGVSRIVDLTATIGPELVVFESKEGLGVDHRYQSSSQKDGDPANVSELRFGAHTGTHVDAPRHFARTNDAGVETLSLSWLNGPAVVVDVFDAVALDAATLRSVAGSIPDGVTRVLFRTDNTRRGIMSTTAFDETYVGFTEDGARWLVTEKPNVKVVGVDYVSIAAYAHLVTAHVVLLEAGIVPVEGLLIPEETVVPGWWMFHCAPLKLLGSDGAPARAWLAQMEA